MKKILLMALFAVSVVASFAQARYFTRSGNVRFSAGTPLEMIDGDNNAVSSVLEAGTGRLEFGLLVKGFEFKSALMQEHFNENYLESDKYPKSTFKGTVREMAKLDLQKPGEYPVTVNGQLSIHGVVKDVSVNGTIKVTAGTVSATAVFPVTLEEYKIEIPGLVKDKVSKTATVKVTCNYALLPAK